jgi:cullin 4
LHALGQPKLPTNFEEDTWAILKDAITAIFLKQKLSCDVEKLYQVIFVTYTQRFHALL